MKRVHFSPHRRGIATVLAMAGVAVALTATTGAGVSYADDGKPLGVPESSLSADGKFFTPGPNTLVKRNSSAAESGELSTEAPSSISPAPAGTTDFYRIKNAHWISQSCGTDVIQATSGGGKTTLVLTVDKSVSATVTKEINVDLK